MDFDDVGTFVVWRRCRVTLADHFCDYLYSSGPLTRFAGVGGHIPIQVFPRACSLLASRRTKCTFNIIGPHSFHQSTVLAGVAPRIGRAPASSRSTPRTSPRPRRRKRWSLRKRRAIRSRSRLSRRSRGGALRHRHVRGRDRRADPDPDQGGARDQREEAVHRDQHRAGDAHELRRVHQRARIAIPWNLTLHDRACLGDRANAYSLGPIEIGARATVAQE